MDAAKHSPLPWRVVNGSQIRDELMPFDRDERDTALIATTGIYASTELAEANAAFIVRAVNSHEQLVAALRDLLPDAVGNHIGGPDTQARIDLARAALAAAGEQP